MKFLLAEKQQMTQIYDDQGVVHPGTLLKVGLTAVTAIKTLEKDGYTAVQVGYGLQKVERLSKAVAGHLKGAAFKKLREFRVSDTTPYAETGAVSLEAFVPGDVVQVQAVSKGKGFQGVVKRHGFGGGRRSHGQKHSEREPGSIGGGGRAGGRVIKGMRMAGRMGGDTITVRNLKVLAVDTVNQTILISGAIPGARGALVTISTNTK
jgi:large subunit ribosomal protein L3